MTPLQVESISIQKPHKQSTAKVVAKAVLVAAVIAGLATALFFGIGAFAGLIAAGAASWKIGLVGAAVIATTISLFGSSYFAPQHNMFEDTGDNLAESGRFLRDTLGAGFHALVWGVEAVKEWEIWDMITSRP